MISLNGVGKSYIKGVPTLEDVNIKIKKGEFVFIVGDSGAGKSTLIRLLLRELKPTTGTITVNGMRVDKIRNGKIPKLRRSMGVVFQDFKLLKDRNVYENVAFAQRIIQTPIREMKRNVPNMLAMVGLAGKYKAKTTELSGGEQQRVAIARALVNEPPILICDEPTGNLDPKNTVEIMNLLDRINKNGTTVVVVTHNDKIVNDMQKRVITIKNGVVVSDEEMGVYLDEDN
ncbi:MAG: cell division ATP-binding protein FtsE [Lachnospiraceae bacterium]|nr:cell division ATP-binding protein FtsE [Lachnospiraceae bacterium]